MFLIRPDIKTLKEEEENINWETMCDMQGTLFHDKRSCIGNKERETTITNSMFYKKKNLFNQLVSFNFARISKSWIVRVVLKIKLSILIKIGLLLVLKYKFPCLSSYLQVIRGPALERKNWFTKIFANSSYLVRWW